MMTCSRLMTHKLGMYARIYCGNGFVSQFLVTKSQLFTFVRLLNDIGYLSNSELTRMWREVAASTLPEDFPELEEFANRIQADNCDKKRKIVT